VGGMPIGRQPLHDLQLCSSSSMHASSSQLLQLLGLPWQQPGVQARPTRLQVLALVGIRGVDNSFLAALTAAGCPQLRHLRLEECYRCDCDSRRGCREGADRVSSSSSSRGAAPEQQQVSPCRPTGPAFTQDALLALLPACPALHSLRLRHVAPLTAGFCRSVAAAAPLLRHLLVDGCDLGGVPWVRLAPDPHGALVEVQVGVREGPGVSVHTSKAKGGHMCEQRHSWCMPCCSWGRFEYSRVRTAWHAGPCIAQACVCEVLLQV
jgi:hypothetical protein